MKNTTANLLKIASLSLASLALFNSCATYRGMPSHGGGKRFDEEQRVVTASIRHAAEKMDFSAIKKRKIALEVTSLETSGTGEPFYSGLGELSGYFEHYSEIQRKAGDVSQDLDKSRDLGRYVPKFEFNPRLKSNNNITREDIVYLQKALEMRLRHDGFQITPLDQADVYLVVLVDALGTNLSRRDFGVAYEDDLGASCEMTYYAIDPETQKIVASSKSVGSSSHYKEANLRFTPIRKHIRSVGDFNDRIAPLPSKANGEFNGGRRGVARVYKDPLKQELNRLSQEAESYLDANDRENARKMINKIRKIDPSFTDLPDLQEQLKNL